ncbi:MAG: hypothetical protein V1659_00330 [Candidatus Woesearchaeota archaeon]
MISQLAIPVAIILGINHLDKTYTFYAGQSNGYNCEVIRSKPDSDIETPVSIATIWSDGTEKSMPVFVQGVDFGKDYLWEVLTVVESDTSTGFKRVFLDSTRTEWLPHNQVWPRPVAAPHMNIPPYRLPEQRRLTKEQIWQAESLLGNAVYELVNPEHVVPRENIVDIIRKELSRVF